LIFNYARNFSRTSSAIDVLEDQDGKTVTDDLAKANILNAFFTSVQTNEEHLLGDIPVADEPSQNKIHFKHITELCVSRKMNKLLLNKACGPDGLHVNVLKRVPAFAQPLHLLFYQSVLTSTIPQDWRDSNIKDCRYSFMKNFPIIDFIQTLCMSRT